MRLVDADALVGTLHNVTFEDGTDREIVYRCVELAPTIEERKTSKWNLTEIHNCYEVYQCEECKRKIHVFHRVGDMPTIAKVTEDNPYCHCGAKMEVDNRT